MTDDNIGLLSRSIMMDEGNLVSGATHPATASNNRLESSLSMQNESNKVVSLVHTTMIIDTVRTSNACIHVRINLTQFSGP